MDSDLSSEGTSNTAHSDTHSLTHLSSVEEKQVRVRYQSRHLYANPIFKFAVFLNGENTTQEYSLLNKRYLKLYKFMINQENVEKESNN